MKPIKRGWGSNIAPDHVHVLVEYDPTTPINSIVKAFKGIAACITSYIVFLLAFAGLSEMTVVTSRTFDTAIGGVFALLANSLPVFKAVRKHLPRRHGTRR